MYDGFEIKSNSRFVSATHEAISIFDKTYKLKRYIDIYNTIAIIYSTYDMFVYVVLYTFISVYIFT